MTLSSILENSGASFDASHANDEVRDLIFDSRIENPKQNSIFVCIKGFTFDSHDHAKKMYDKGVRYFVSEKQLDLPAGMAARSVIGPDVGTLRTGESFDARAGITYGFIVTRE